MASAHTEAWKVRPTAARQEIVRDGLVPHPEFDGDDLWFFDSAELAEQYAQLAVAEDSFIPTPDGTADVWHIDLRDLDTRHVPHIIDAENLQFVGSIDSRRLHLLRTY